MKSLSQSARAPIPCAVLFGPLPRYVREVNATIRWAIRPRSRSGSPVEIRHRSKTGPTGKSAAHGKGTSNSPDRLCVYLRRSVPYARARWVFYHPRVVTHKVPRHTRNQAESIASASGRQIRLAPSRPRPYPSSCDRHPDAG
jgi:hypothetical protein